MAYKVKYYLEWTGEIKDDAKGIEPDQFRIDILKKDYTGFDKVKLTAGYPAAILRYTQTQDDKFTPIRWSELQINLIGTDQFGLRDIYAMDARMFKIILYRNGDVMWQGYNALERIMEDFGAEPYSFQLRAVDGLDSLKNETFLNSQGKVFQGYYTPVEIILNCLQKINPTEEVYLRTVDNLYEDTMKTDINDDPLNQMFLNVTRMVGSDDEPYDCKKVLETICAIRGAVIYQSGGDWVFARVLELAGGQQRVRLYQRNALGTTTGPQGYKLNPNKFITSHTQSGDEYNKNIIFVNADHQQQYLPSRKRVSVNLKYGEPLNRLANGRFNELDTYDPGNGTLVQRPLGWKSYNGLVWSLETPVGANIWDDRYVKFYGSSPQYKDYDVGLTFVWNNPGSDFNNLKPDSLSDKKCFISYPFVVKPFEVIKLSGEFLNANCRGAKVQVMITPILNEVVIPFLRAKRYAITPSYESEYHKMPLTLTPDGKWDYPFSYVGQQIHIDQMRPALSYENTKESKEGTKIVNVAKGTWSSFEVESAYIPPVSSVEFYANDNLTANFYCCRVILFGGTEYIDPKPSTFGEPTIQFRNIKVSVRDYFASQDITEEEFRVEQNNPFGETEEIDVDFGDGYGNPYYAYPVIRDASKPDLVYAEWWKRFAFSEKRRMLHQVALSRLTAYRKPTRLLEGSYRGQNLAFENAYMTTFTGREIMIPLRFEHNLSKNQVSLSLAETPIDAPDHTFTRFGTNADGNKFILEGPQTVTGEAPPYAGFGGSLSIDAIQINGMQVTILYSQKDPGSPPYFITIQNDATGVKVFDNAQDAASPFTATMPYPGSYTVTILDSSDQKVSQRFALQAPSAGSTTIKSAVPSCELSTGTVLITVNVNGFVPGAMSYTFVQGSDLIDYGPMTSNPKVFRLPRLYQGVTTLYVSNSSTGDRAVTSFNVPACKLPRRFGDRFASKFS